MTKPGESPEHDYYEVLNAPFDYPNPPAPTGWRKPEISREAFDRLRQWEIVLKLEEARDGLRKKYQALTKQADQDTRRDADRRYNEVNEAYEVLSDERGRDYYNRTWTRPPLHFDEEQNRQGSEAGFGQAGSGLGAPIHIQFEPDPPPTTEYSISPDLCEKFMGADPYRPGDRDMNAINARIRHQNGMVAVVVLHPGSGRDSQYQVSVYGVTDPGQIAFFDDRIGCILIHHGDRSVAFTREGNVVEFEGDDYNSRIGAAVHVLPFRNVTKRGGIEDGAKDELSNTLERFGITDTNRHTQIFDSLSRINRGTSAQDRVIRAGPIGMPQNQWQPEGEFPREQEPPGGAAPQSSDEPPIDIAPGSSPDSPIMRYSHDSNVSAKFSWKRGIAVTVLATATVLFAGYEACGYAYNKAFGPSTPATTSSPAPKSGTKTAENPEQKPSPSQPAPAPRKTALKDKDGVFEIVGRVGNGDIQVFQVRGDPDNPVIEEKDGKLFVNAGGRPWPFPGTLKDHPDVHIFRLKDGESNAITSNGNDGIQDACSSIISSACTDVRKFLSAPPDPLEPYRTYPASEKWTPIASNRARPSQAARDNFNVDASQQAYLNKSRNADRRRA